MAVSKFTKEEDNLLRKYYSTKTKNELQQMFNNHSWHSVMNHAKQVLGLSRKEQRVPNQKIWTEKDDQRIQTLLEEGLSCNKVAEHLNVSFSQLMRRLSKLGTTANKIKKNDWTPEEEQILLNHFQNAPKEYILRLLPDKNWLQLSKYARNHFSLKRHVKDVKYCNYQLFDTWTEASAYILGFIMADGNVHLAEKSSQRNVLQINVVIDDADVIYKIQKALQFEGKLLYVPGKTVNSKAGEYNQRPQVKICITNRYLIEQAIAKGIPAKDKTFTASYPITIPENMHRHFIRGLVDGDGSSIFRNNSYHFGLCGTYNIVKPVKDILGIENKLVQNQKHPVIWTLSIAGPKAFEVGKWLYEDATIYLNRKFANYQLAKNKYENN